jgi:hypothetical protein
MPMNAPGGTPALSEQLRLNLATPPTPIGAGSRLGLLDGDLAGFPNGRRLTDDVFVVRAQLMAGAAYPLLHAGATVDPRASELTDGVDTDELPLRSAFPFLATPAEADE